MSSQAVADRIFCVLRQEVIDGLWLPGAPLTESELATRFNSSRNSVREALHQLSYEGLTLHIRNRGVVVKEMSAKDISEIFTVRRTIELAAIQSFRPHMQLHLEQMSSAIEDSQRAYEQENWRQMGSASLRFHQAIVAILESDMLNELFIRVSAQLRLLFAMQPDEQKFQLPWLTRDAHLFELLESAQLDAAVEELAAYLDDSEANVQSDVASMQPILK